MSDRVSRGCERLTGEVAQAATSAGQLSPEHIRAQNRAITAFVADVRSLGEETLSKDYPSIAYLADWESLRDACEKYAAALDVGSGGSTPHFVLPQTPDGYPITRRMNIAQECTALADLTALP